MHAVNVLMIVMMMIRAHSFSREILPNSLGQFAKFRGLPWQNHPNSTAHCSLSFVSKMGTLVSEGLAGIMTLC